MLLSGIIGLWINFDLRSERVISNQFEYGNLVPCFPALHYIPYLDLPPSVTNLIMTLRTFPLSCLLAFVISCQSKSGGETNTRADTLQISKTDHTQEIMTRMQGEWTHSEDSLSVVEVADNRWTFRYPDTAPDQYQILIEESLRPSGNDDATGDFFILTNKEDTLHYEITTLTEETLSLIYYPRGNTLTYNRKK